MSPKHNGDSRSKSEPNSSKRSKGCCAIIRTLSVEPAGFLVIMSVVVSHLIFQNLMMETICRVDLGYETETCKEIINKVNITYKEQEREIQKVAAGVQAITSVIFSSLTVLIVLFVGPWSDANGRKAPLLLSIGGLIMYSGMMIVCYLSLGKIRALYLALMAMLPLTISGGGVVFAMSAYSYVADTTSPEDRTVRTGILSASVRSGTPIGFAIGGLLTKYKVGVVPSLIFSIALTSVSFLIVLFFVKNTKPAEAVEDEKAMEKRNRRKKQSAWVKYNPLMKLYEAFAILFQKRKERLTFFLLIFTHVCYAAPGSGEYSMLYLFVRERLQWNVSDYGFFSMYNWLMSAAGVVLSMFFLSKILKISDPWVGLVAGLSQIGGSTLYAFSATALMMYCASTTDMMNGTIGVVVRSMLSKIVEADEVGKLFALLGVIESLMPLVMVPTYAMVYRGTVTTFAGAFFLLSAGVTIPAEFIFLYFICTGKGKSTKEPDADHPVPLDQLQSTLEALNKSMPDIAKPPSHDMYASHDKLPHKHHEEEEGLE